LEEIPSKLRREFVSARSDGEVLKKVDNKMTVAFLYFDHVQLVRAVRTAGVDAIAALAIEINPHSFDIIRDVLA